MVVEGTFTDTLKKKVKPIAIILPVGETAFETVLKGRREGTLSRKTANDS
jgi:hypothetical protein